jgi:hypothetical protein
MDHDIVDVIIIGAGIAGLYTAYKIQKLSPKTSILILERNGKAGIGGRMGTVSFQGTDVAIGAGIGRKAKDKRLLALVNELKIPTHEFLAKSHISPRLAPCSLESTFLGLKRAYRIGRDSGKTFRDYAIEQIGKEAYAHFRACAGYTDYENEDAFDTLYDYGFEDNYTEFTGVSIPWTTLVDTLAARFPIQTHTEVKRISQKDGGGYEVHTNRRTLSCKKVVVATTVDTVRALFPSLGIYKDICGQTFLRMYGRFTKASVEILRTVVTATTVVPGPIHKIIPMNPDKGVYMIVYSDNAGARALYPYIENTAPNRAALSRKIEVALGLESGSLDLVATRGFYWPIGTHYYKPLDRKQFKTRDAFLAVAQRPDPGIRIVGEMISRNQGWSEGAIESVDAVIDREWLRS